jgi:hypothetical protein
MKAMTTAIITWHSEFYNAAVESRVTFIRPRNRFLTAKGCQRLINQGCEETDFEAMPHLSVVRIERAALGN